MMLPPQEGSASFRLTLFEINVCIESKKIKLPLIGWVRNPRLSLGLRGTGWVYWKKKKRARLRKLALFQGKTCIFHDPPKEEEWRSFWPCLWWFCGFSWPVSLGSWWWEEGDQSSEITRLRGKIFSLIGKSESVSRSVLSNSLWPNGL